MKQCDAAGFLDLHAVPSLRAILSLPFLAAIHAYRVILGPWLGGHCRFYPTCSQYALDAYRAHGPTRGTILTLKRLAKCHPWGPHGIDTVPPPANIPSRSPGKSPK